MYPPEEVEAIGRWAVEHGIWVVTDEIYEHLTYGAHEFSSMPAVVPELAEPCLIVNGVAKTYAMTGWRVGWMIGPKDVIDAATNLQSHATSQRIERRRSAPRSPRCRGDLEAGAHDARVLRAARPDRCTDMLNDIPGVTCLEPQGAFYCFPSFEGVLGRSIAGRDCRRQRSSWAR